LGRGFGGLGAAPFFVFFGTCLSSLEQINVDGAEVEQQDDADCKGDCGHDLQGVTQGVPFLRLGCLFFAFGQGFDVCDGGAKGFCIDAEA
jgi:hypothetical protein